MLDMGFADAIKKIIETITKHQDKDKHFQRILLSATPTTGFLKTKFKKNLFYFQFSVALNDFVDISLNKNPLRIDLSEEFNDQSVITVPSKLRFVTLIAFLLKIFNTKVSSLNTLRNSSCFI